MNVYKLKNSVVIEDLTDEEIQGFQKIEKISTGNFENEKNILPRPVIRDGNGKLIKDHTPRDFYLKLQEEIFEAIENLEIYNQMTVEYGEGYDGTKSAVKYTAEEIANIMTLCISFLNAIGYGEKKRSELFEKINKENEEYGCFDEEN